MNKKQRILAGLGVAALVAGSGVAYAAWSATGTGSGAARAASAQALVVTAGTTTADLYPGFTQGDVFLRVTNPNPYGVNVTSLTPGTITTSAPGCAATNITIAPATGLNIPVAANASNFAVTVPNIVTMIAAAPDACQGVTFTINVTLGGVQV
jgi:hypothetical protein